jgi:hypothetical protein
VAAAAIRSNARRRAGTTRLFAFLRRGACLRRSMVDAAPAGIVFTAYSGGIGRIWRAAVPHGRPHLLESVGESASHPAISPAGDHLVYEQVMSDQNIYVADLARAGESSPAIVSTLREQNLRSATPTSTISPRSENRSSLLVPSLRNSRSSPRSHRPLSADRKVLQNRQGSDGIGTNTPAKNRPKVIEQKIPAYQVVGVVRLIFNAGTELERCAGAPLTWLGVRSFR